MVESCTVTKSGTKVLIEENKRKAVFLNPKNEKYKVIKVDGCVIKSGRRCDYIVQSPCSHSILVELKGVDVSHACEQLFVTAENEEIKEIIDKKIGFLVVCSKYPRIDSFVMKAKQRAASKYRAGFHVVTKAGEFKVGRVAAIDGPF